MNEKLGNKILELIKRNNIKPIPKWELLLRNSFIWFLTIVSIILGSFGFAVIIHMLRNNDWDICRELGGNYLFFFIGSIPYLWIIFLIISILIGEYYFQHTKDGYRYRAYGIFLAGIIITIIIGSVFYIFGFGQALDNALSKEIPLYEKYANPRTQTWSRPHSGRLGGTIIELSEKPNFKLRDFHGKKWLIINKENLEKTNIMGVGIKIRITGRQIGPNEFEAWHIRPFIFKQSPKNLIIPK